MMTNVNIEKEKEIIVVSVLGHADYDISGKDIVCAALSAITQSLLQALRYYEANGKCKLLTVKESAGAMFFSFRIKDKKCIEPLLNMAVIGYKTLELSYPENVNAKFFDMGL